jgi:hypothetical protein
MFVRVSELAANGEIQRAWVNVSPLPRDLFMTVRLFLRMVHPRVLAIRAVFDEPNFSHMSRICHQQLRTASGSAPWSGPSPV